jgi:hypothetical protein
MNSTSIPALSNTRAPTFTRPLLVKISQSLFSFSFGSGLCSQSSFSTSSGNSNSPAEGRMLYFSETVWVLRSSSLPALEGARESSKGEANGPNLESRLPADSELQLVRRDDRAEGDRNGDSSLKGLFFDFLGGSRSSADSATPALR